MPPVARSAMTFGIRRGVSRRGWVWLVSHSHTGRSSFPRAGPAHGTNPFPRRRCHRHLAGRIRQGRYPASCLCEGAASSLAGQSPSSLAMDRSLKSPPASGPTIRRRYSLYSFATSIASSRSAPPSSAEPDPQGAGARPIRASTGRTGTTDAIIRRMDATSVVFQLAIATLLRPPPGIPHD